MVRLTILIPARKGSKRVKGKNMVIIDGYPLLYYTIQQAIETCLAREIIVSTDWDECEDLAIEMGVNISRRPEEISQDDSHDYEWVRYAMENAHPSDAFMILRPTSPLRTVRMILSAWAKFQTVECDSLRAVCKTSCHPFKSWIMDGAYISPLFEYRVDDFPSYDMPTQRLPEIYVQTGALQIAWNRVLEKETVSGEKIIPYIMDGLETLDLNTPEDLNYIRYIIQRRGMI